MGVPRGLGDGEGRKGEERFADKPKPASWPPDSWLDMTREYPWRGECSLGEPMLESEGEEAEEGGGMPPRAEAGPVGDVMPPSLDCCWCRALRGLVASVLCRSRRISGSMTWRWRVASLSSSSWWY